MPAPVLRLMRHSLIVGLLLLLWSAPASAQEPPPAPEPELVTFGIGPSGPERPDDRPDLSYGLAPGSVVYDHVAVLNSSDVPLDLLLYSADATNLEDGGLDLRKRGEPNTDLGGWITSPVDRVTVPPQSTETGRGLVVVPITITVPPDASPGDHSAGVAVGLLSRGDSAGSQNIELEQRVAARVFVRVAGPLEPRLTTAVVATRYVADGPLGGSVEVDYRVVNNGNVRLAADTSVSVAGPFGLGRTSVDGPPLDQLLPGQSAVLQASIPGVRPLIRLGVDLTVTPRAPAGSDAPDSEPATASAGLWAVPWLLLAVLGLVLAVVAGLVRMRRRRRAVPPTSAPPPARHLAAK